jgi:hypothetical protein
MEANQEIKIICSVCDAELRPDGDGNLEYFILRDGRICCTSVRCMRTVKGLPS